jgi:hypothetical protein
VPVLIAKQTVTIRNLQRDMAERLPHKNKILHVRLSFFHQKNFLVTSLDIAHHKVRKLVCIVSEVQLANSSVKKHQSLPLKGHLYELGCQFFEGARPILAFGLCGAKHNHKMLVIPLPKKQK